MTTIRIHYLSFLPSLCPIGFVFPQELNPSRLFRLAVRRCCLNS